MNTFEKLHFLFVSQDENTRMDYSSSCIHLTTRAAHPEKVAAIASRMGIASKILEDNTLTLSVPIIMKNDVQPQPETELQIAIKTMLHGDGEYIGLMEYLSYFQFQRHRTLDSFSYGISYLGSKIEQNYLKKGGWNNTRINGAGKFGFIELPTDHALVNRFVQLLAEKPIWYSESKFYTEIEKEWLPMVDSSPRTLGEVLKKLNYSSWLFPNGEKIRLLKVGDGGSYQIGLQLQEPSIFRELVAHLLTVANGEQFQSLIDNGTIGRYIEEA